MYNNSLKQKILDTGRLFHSLLPHNSRCSTWKILSSLMSSRELGLCLYYFAPRNNTHYSDFIMGAMASQITSLSIVYPTVYSGTDQRKHQGSASLAFVRGIHRWSVDSPHKRPVTWKMFPFDDVIMIKHQSPALMAPCESNLPVWISRTKSK